MASWSGEPKTTNSPPITRPLDIYKSLNTPPPLDIEKLAGEASLREVIEGYSRPKPEIQIKK